MLRDSVIVLIAASRLPGAAGVFLGEYVIDAAIRFGDRGPVPLDGTSNSFDSPPFFNC